MAKVLEMPKQDINKLTEIDKKDFWMQLNTKRAESKITKKDIGKFKEKGIEGKELDKKIEELRRKSRYRRRIGRINSTRFRSVSY